MSGYEVERHRLRAHADQLDDYNDAWNRRVARPLSGPETTPDSLAFTSAGADFWQEYSNIHAEYSGYIGGAGAALSAAATGLLFTAKTYGEAEEEVISEIHKLETPEVKSGGSIHDLLNP